MIWKIAKKEFLLNLMTFKFAVGAIACVVLTAVFTPVLAVDYQNRLKIYNMNTASNEAELRKVKVYKNIKHTVYRPPAVLSAFSAGLEKQMAGSAKIELDKVPELSVTQRKGNPYLPILAVFDESLIFKIVISVLALLAAYDVISGERKRGTLKLMLSGETARHQVLLGKFLAGLITLSVPVAITFVIGIVIFVSFPIVTLSGSDWIRIGLMFLASMIFTSVMYLLGLLFSCVAKRPEISMALGLFLWIIFLFVIPNVSIHLATEIHPLVLEEKKNSQLALLKAGLNNELDNIKIDTSDAIEKSSGDDVFGGWYERIIDKAWFKAYQKEYKLTYPIKIKYADRFWDVEHSYLNSFFRQRYLANRLSRISPISTYENLMAVFAGTDLVSFQHFINDVRAHRMQVIEYIRLKTDNFSSGSFFATCTEEEAAEYTKLFLQERQAEDETERAIAGKARSDLRTKKIAETPPSLKLQDFPWFRYRPSLFRDLQTAIPDLFVLFIANVVLLVMCFVAFGKYDVR
jgi:ABC-type transport system involved in multi-copper enzyme maturation permease subunit